jgi:hypothetical protein
VISIDCEVLTGTARFQILIIPAFAMTINKSQVGSKMLLLDQDIWRLKKQGRILKI